MRKAKNDPRRDTEIISRYNLDKTLFNKDERIRVLFQRVIAPES